MTTAHEHIKANLIAYLLPVAAMAMWAGFTAFMDGRHDEKGASEVVRSEVLTEVQSVQSAVLNSIERSELKQLKRERRKLIGYERNDPGSKYSIARQGEIDELTDEIAAIETK